jgi:hypothetical protein
MTSTDLVPTGPGSLARWVSVLVPASQLAERIADTDFVPKAMRGKPEAVTAAIMYGDEIGVGPMQALASISVVEGRPQPSAELMRGLILRAGHTITVHTLTGEVCRVSGLRAGSPEQDRVTIEWNLAMARAAGLLSKLNWRNYPRAMLLARATGDLARLLFPDVVKGLGHFGDDSETVEGVESWANAIPDDTPVAPATTRVSRRPRLPSPGHLPLATPEHPAPDGTVDVPLPEVVPDGPPEQVDPEPWKGAEDAPGSPPAAQDTQPGVTTPDQGGEAATAPSEAPTRRDPNRPIGPGLHRGLMAAFTAVAPDHDHDLRVALASAILATKIETTKTLTAAQALTLTRILNDIQTGAVAWSRDESGTVTLERVRES